MKKEKKKKKRMNSEGTFIAGIIRKNDIGQRVSRNKNLHLREQFIIYHEIFRLNGTRAKCITVYLRVYMPCIYIYIFNVIPEQENEFSSVI